MGSTGATEMVWDQVRSAFRATPLPVEGRERRAWTHDKVITELLVGRWPEFPFFFHPVESLLCS